MEQIENNDYLIDFQFIKQPVYFDGIRLYQVGKKFCNEFTIVPSHTHINWFELTVVLEGKGKIYVNRNVAHVSEGDIFLSFPCDIHKIESDTNNPLKYSFLSFCLESENYKEDFNNITQNYYECEKRVFRDATIPTLIDQLIMEMSLNEYGKEKVVSCVLQQLLIFIHRDFSQRKNKNISNKVNHNEILCYKIMRYIDNNLFDIEILTDISKHFNYNYSYIAKIFKKTTNLTITQYLSNKKLERAKILIKEGNLSFTKIAELLNYASIYSFSKMFKLHFGLSPADYKRQHQNPNA